MMRSVVLPFALVVCAACDDAGRIGDVSAEQPDARQAPIPDAAAADTPTIDGMTQIDPDPAPASSPRIVSRETIEVGGKPACAITVRYPGHIDQEATWAGEPCDAPDIAIIDAARLREAGQLDDLQDEARIDIERMTDGVLVVESRFSASAFPLNVAGRIYEVPYAD